MKKLIALLVSLLVLTPALAVAHEHDDVLLPTKAEVRNALNTEARPGALKAELRANASTTKPLTPGSVPKLGPAIKNFASSTRALGSSTVEMVKARVAAIKEIIANKHEVMKARADDARHKAKERFGERVETLVGNVSARLASTSANLDAIADRIDSRIDTLQDEGHDMDESIALLATARTDLSIANDKILAVNVALEAAMSTTTPKGEIPAVRAAVKAAEDALKLVKDDLMKTLRSIKVEAGATTTSSN